MMRIHDLMSKVPPLFDRVTLLSQELESVKVALNEFREDILQYLYSQSKSGDIAIESTMIPMEVEGFTGKVSVFFTSMVKQTDAQGRMLTPCLDGRSDTMPPVRIKETLGFWCDFSTHDLWRIALAVHASRQTAPQHS